MSEQWRGEIFLARDRDLFANKTILIAGCGAEGSHVATALGSVMMHAKDTRLILADPDTFAEGNLGIQVVDHDYLGDNKAEATQDMLAKKFPGMTLEAYPEGITPENAEPLVAEADYVVDATDIFVTDIASILHAKARVRDIPVVVPWSIGYGGAVAAFGEQGGFDAWGEHTEAIALEEGFPELQNIARWIVDIPKGLTRQYMVDMQAGTVPTPVTYFGSTTGSQLAARWIMLHQAGEAPPLFPTVTIHKVDGLNSCTIQEDYEIATREALGTLRAADTHPHNSDSDPTAGSVSTS